MVLSSTPFLVAIELGFVAMVTWRCGRLGTPRSQIAAVYLYLSWIAAYALLTGVLGARGLYVSEDLLALLPGLWLQLITVMVCIVPLILSPNLRNGLWRIVDTTPWHWFAYLHSVRIAALGTAYKTLVGEFPVYFEVLIGVPDLLFGVSAFWVARQARHGRIGRRAFMVWNLIGALVIVPWAPLLLQLGLPGPLQIFTSLPDARAVFTYPMSIASMIAVPLFVLINLLVTWRLWERERTGVKSEIAH